MRHQRVEGAGVLIDFRWLKTYALLVSFGVKPSAVEQTYPHQNEHVWLVVCILWVTHHGALF